MDNRSVGYKSLLQYPNYMLVWFGQTTANLGDSLYQIAFYWLSYKMTDSAWIAGLVVLATSVPYLFFGLIGGACADRWDRKRLMLLSDLIRLLAIMMIPLFYWMDQLNAWNLGSLFIEYSTLFLLSGIAGDDSAIYSTRTLGCGKLIHAGIFPVYANCRADACSSLLAGAMISSLGAAGGYMMGGIALVLVGLSGIGLTKVILP